MQLAASVAGGKSFTSDQFPVPLQLTGATLLGNSVTATNIEWTSSLQGSLGAQSSLATPLQATLATGAHTHHRSRRLRHAGHGVEDAFHSSVLPFQQAVPTALASEMPGAAWSIPVVMINVIPTEDGSTVDSSVTGPSGNSEWTPGSIEALQAWIITCATRAKFMLEEGSKFRGYKQPGATPQLGYRIVAIYNFYQPFKPGKPDPGRAGNFFPDYFELLEQIPTQQLVEQQHVREIWLNGYHYGTTSLNESNMASPATGDVSNSYRSNDDLPLFSSTYVLYQNNYTRSHAEAVHNHGHQIEAMLAHINQRYDGNTELFWQKFVGWDASNRFAPGRCGATHWPLNARQDYDYNNAADRVMSDCEDWRPGGGTTKEVLSRYLGVDSLRLACDRRDLPADRIAVVHLLDAEPARARQLHPLQLHADRELVDFHRRLGRGDCRRHAAVSALRRWRWQRCQTKRAALPAPNKIQCCQLLADNCSADTSRPVIPPSELSDKRCHSKPAYVVSAVPLTVVALSRIRGLRIR